MPQGLLALDEATAAKSLPKIEFWFEFASPYSYLSVMRIEDAARQRGVRVAWKPFILGPIFKALGMRSEPVSDQKAKGAYIWVDLRRQARKYGLRWVKPTAFPRVGVLPARVALLGAEQPWIGDFCRRVMELNFVLDQEMNEPAPMARILADLGLPVTEILEEAQADSNKNRLREQTQEARLKGIFGAPNFFVGTEMFWGNDRLDDALLVAAG